MLVALLSLLAVLSDADLKFLKDYAETRSCTLGRPNSIKLTADGSAVLFLRSPPRSPEMRLYAFEVASGAVRELVTPEQVLKGAQESLSPEERSHVAGDTSLGVYAKFVPYEQVYTSRHSVETNGPRSVTVERDGPYHSIRSPGSWCESCTDGGC